MENLQEYEGKTILKIEKGETFVEITFTDGSKLEMVSRGSEEQWIEVYAA